MIFDNPKSMKNTFRATTFKVKNGKGKMEKGKMEFKDFP